MTGAPTAEAAAALPTFASLRIRNYKLFFWGQLVSVSGTWLQGTAQAWLVLKELKGGAGALGLLSGLMMMPTLLFGLWAGVLADRYDRRKLVMATNTWAAITAGVLAVLTLTGTVRLWMVFVIAFATGLSNAVEMPTRQAFVSELVPTTHVQNAVGLNSATFNGGRVFGPAIAGLLIVLVGTGWCFAINSASFVASSSGSASCGRRRCTPGRGRRAPEARSARASGTHGRRLCCAPRSCSCSSWACSR